MGKIVLEFEIPAKIQQLKKMTKLCFVFVLKKTLTPKHGAIIIKTKNHQL
jgi:hypothetical protein